MKIPCYTLALSLLSFWSYSQVPNTANDFVKPYTGGFHPAANMGSYGPFTDETLSELAAGNPATGLPGAGVKSLRPGLFGEFVEQWGYESRLPAFEHYKTLGMGEHTVIVGFPSDAQRDPAQYCPGIQSELFANLYTPIWDGGANGTPYNDDNFYAAYLYKTVSLYKDYVRFWEIWNEPGFDYTGGLGYAQPGSPGNWWDNNPDPCDYKLRAPIFHYIRLLRISWEIIKSIDPDAYVVVSGTGYPSFLDAILRNTDNPADGSVTATYPLKGGAYFDVMGYHSYPHFDGSLREWSDALNDWLYYRHSDAAAEGVLKTKNTYRQLLEQYGYNGTTYPEKLWIITEINLPRKPFGEYIGSAEAQRNFMIKAMAACMANDILQMQVYKLGEDTYYDNAHSEFDLMGLYQRLNYNSPYFQELNEEGIAHKTTSEQLFGKTFDPDRTAQMALDAGTGGGAFRDEDGNFTYLLWAKTMTDQSEQANGVYSFPAAMNVQLLLKREWDAGMTQAAAPMAATNIALTATPIFLTERIFTMNAYHGCAPFGLNLAAQVAGAAQWIWTVEKQAGPSWFFFNENPSVTLDLPGAYSVTLEASNAAGQTIAKQTQNLYVGAAVQPAFSVFVSGPVAHFQNLTDLGNTQFDWDFGDGTGSQAAAPTHVYLQSGTFTVKLTASNGCGALVAEQTIEAVSPSTSLLQFTANDSIPAFNGHFRPGTSWDFVPGWTDEQIADIAAGNTLKNVQGTGAKAFRTYIGESFFLDSGYDAKQPLFQHYENLDLRDNTFLLAFPSAQSRDPYYYCPDNRSNLFKNLYLDIWDDGSDGTPVNEANPFALYVWNTVSAYKNQVKFWEIYNSPDFDLTGDLAWLPPGELGNWWENNPDPCDYELRAPIFYYIRSLRIAYEIIRYLDPDAYVTLSGLAFPSFLDAVCRNTDNPLDGSVAGPYPLKGGAYFDAVGFKSYPHFDGSTIYFDLNTGTFAYERHSDAAVSGISRVMHSFRQVLDKHGYDGVQFPEKEWIISEANIPRKQFYDYLGSAEAQRNWLIKAWTESVKNGIRQLDFFRLAESSTFAEAVDPFEVMGFYQKMEGIAPYNQVPNEQGIALKTCSDLLFGTTFDPAKTAALNLPDHIGGAAFRDAEGNYTYVLWAKTNTDQSEATNAMYSFPSAFGISQLRRRAWDYSLTQQITVVSPNNLPLTGAPVFLSEASLALAPPVAFFVSDKTETCTDGTVSFTSKAINQPLYWEWTFEGGVPAVFIGETPPAVTYPSPGTFSVSLLVKNAAGEHKATYTNLVEVLTAPTADFDAVVNGAAVQFVNLSQSQAGPSDTVYEWCYGDGFCDNAVNPVYTYFQNGTYDVTLTVTNDCGSATHSQTIVIASAPSANFIHNFWGNCGELLTFFVDQSFSGPTSWEWHFPGAVPAFSTLQFPTVTFASGGWHEVTLIAGNAFGADTLVRQVYIEGPIFVEMAPTLCTGSEFNGIPVFQDTVVTLILPTFSLGCDSTIHATISVTDHIETHHEESLCEGAWFHGVQVFADTVFIETYLLSQGCDSTATTVLTVHPNDTVFLTEAIQPGEYFQVGNQFFTQTGLYQATLENWHGCDSLVVLDLTVLTATVSQDEERTAWRVFPNPFFGKLHVSLYLAEPAPVALEMLDVSGRLVAVPLPGSVLHSGEHLFTLHPDVLPSVYWLRLKSGGSSFVKKIVKI